MHAFSWCCRATFCRIKIAPVLSSAIIIDTCYCCAALRIDSWALSCNGGAHHTKKSGRGLHWGVGRAKRSRGKSKLHVKSSNLPVDACTFSTSLLLTVPKTAYRQSSKRQPLQRALVVVPLQRPTRARCKGLGYASAAAAAETEELRRS